MSGKVFKAVCVVKKKKKWLRKQTVEQKVAVTEFWLRAANLTIEYHPTEKDMGI